MILLGVGGYFWVELGFLSKDPKLLEVGMSRVPQRCLGVMTVNLDTPNVLCQFEQLTGIGVSRTRTVRFVFSIRPESARYFDVGLLGPAKTPETMFATPEWKECTGFEVTIRGDACDEARIPWAGKDIVLANAYEEGIAKGVKQDYVHRSWGEASDLVLDMTRSHASDKIWHLRVRGSAILVIEVPDYDATWTFGTKKIRINPDIAPPSYYGFLRVGPDQIGLVPRYDEEVQDYSRALLSPVGKRPTFDTLESGVENMFRRHMFRDDLIGEDIEFQLREAGAAKQREKLLFFFAIFVGIGSSLAAQAFVELIPDRRQTEGRTS